MNEIKMPTAHTLLLLIAAAVALLTWYVPAGKYDSLQYDKTAKVFIQKNLKESITHPATQETLEKLQVKIPLEKFTGGAIWKPINIPNTYATVTAAPQGLIAYIKSPIKGIIEGADIIFLVLIIGGLIGIMNITGAFEAGIAALAAQLKGREYLLIITVTIAIAIGGTTFGLAEETIAFYPILIPVFLAARYDAIVALASIYIGSSIGTMCSTVNPFSTIIASDAAGINWTTGLEARILFLLISTTVCILYILWYAKRVKKDPKNSIIYAQKEEIEALFGATTETEHKLTFRLRLILILFVLCFVVMIYGVAKLEWWFLEMTSVFLVGAVLIGIIGRIKEVTFVDTFIKGASELLGVALIIGIARGISVLMNDGMISDTLLYYAGEFTEGMPKVIFANVLVAVYGGLSFFIPSSSGMAVLTMPIIAPLADTVAMGREIVVNCYVYGMGLFAFINPTGLILASLAIVKIGYDKWLKFVLPLVGILTLMVIAMISASLYF